MNKIKISNFDLFTGGALTNVNHSKTADFAIFYNIACKNIESIENYFSAGNNRKNKLAPNHQLSNEERYLIEYLWKSSNNIRNRRGDKSTNSVKEREMISALKAKVKEIRNYHSHIWHSNEALLFENELKKFVEQKFNEALEAANEFDPNATQAYKVLLKDNIKGKKLFKKHNNNYYITEEGRIFFLSFFLTTGEMSRFLQQRKGSKRTDTPLFKIKHWIYKFYCHRDGSSILGYSIENNLLAKLSQNKRNDISNARQAYKIITYLNDFPTYLMPEKDNLLQIQSECDGKIIFQNTTSVQDLLSIIHANNLFTNLKFELIKVTNNNISSKDEYELHNSVCIKHDLINEYTFHINYENLYKITSLSLAYNDSKYENIIIEQMIELSRNRLHLYNIINKNENDLSIDDINYLNDKSNRSIRGYRRATETAILYFEQYDKNIKADNVKHRLAEMIRPLNTRGMYLHEPEPIIIHTHDFVMRTEQKFRSSDKFVYYAAKYLSDFNVVKNWKWEMESYAPIKEKQFSNKIIEDNIWRLSIENNHVTVGIENVNSEFKDNLIKFRLGPRAMRYLLAYHLLPDKNKNIDYFLSQHLKKDLIKLLNGENYDNLKLLESKFVPEYLKRQTKEIDRSKFIKDIKTRLNYLNETWNECIKNVHLMKRAEKNREIMKCYQLFNWTIENGVNKFLRKNEYHQISICHYSLENKVLKISEKKRNTRYLINELFKLNERLPKIPEEVINLLINANSIDELLISAINNRKKYLENWLNDIKMLSGTSAKKEYIALAKKIGVDIPPSMKNEVEKQKLKLLQENTSKHIPFEVHPLLILKYAEHECYKTNIDINETVNQKENDLMRKMRNVPYTKGLLDEHYNLDIVGKIYGNMTTCSKYKKMIGTINTVKSEDAILWQIAQKYLENNIYTKDIVKELKKEDNYIKVNAIHNASIKIELKEKGELSPQQNSYWVSMKMHQLDDVMYKNENSTIIKVAKHYLNRNINENTFWENTPREERGLKELNEMIYDGTETNPIPFHVIREELNLVRKTAAYLGGYLLEWERKVINECVCHMNEDEKQKYMLNIHKACNRLNSLEHVSFKSVIAIAKKMNNTLSHSIYNLNEQELNELETYRKDTFHDDIPKNYSYSYWCRENGSIGKMLGVTEPLHWPKDRKKHINS